LGKGADVNARANNGETALMQAGMYCSGEMVKFLRAHGAKGEATPTAIE
jgi:ankyrin repeat protein